MKTLDGILEDLLHIIRGCANNEHKYQKMLYEHYYGYALKITFRYIYRYEKAADIVNDGFVKVFSHFHLFRYNDESIVEKLLMGWIKKIMISTAIDELRKHSFMPEVKSLQEYAWDIKDDAPDVEQQILYKDIISQLRNLTPAYRAVFNMAVIDGYSHQEIAKVLGISVGTSKSNLFKAKMQLQKILINKTMI